MTRLLESEKKSGYPEDVTTLLLRVNQGQTSNRSRRSGCSTHNDVIINEENPFSAALLSIALSVHSILEGIGIGASRDIRDLESAFIAVAFHKGFTAFALASGLVFGGYWTEGKKKYFYLSVGTFIFVALLGIGIGWAISTVNNSVITVILTTITSGSFIYAAVVELLPEQTRTIREHNLMILPCVFSFFTGYCLMTLLSIWT